MEKNNQFNNLSAVQYYLKLYNYDISILPAKLRTVIGSQYLERNPLTPLQIENLLQRYNMPLPENAPSTDKLERESLKKSISALAKMQLDIEQNGGPENNGELFEEHLDALEKVLKNFGLPNTKEHEELLFLNSIPSGNDLEKIIERLHKAANIYLKSPAKTNSQILKEAVEFELNPYNILLELGFSTHLYTLFVYEEILMKQKDDIDSVLAALHATKGPDILNSLGILAFSKEFGKKESEIFLFLVKRGIKYLDLYLSFCEVEWEKQIP